MPLLRGDGAGHGRAESVEVLLSAALFQDQAQIILHHLLPAFGRSIKITTIGLDRGSSTGVLLITVHVLLILFCFF